MPPVGKVTIKGISKAPLVTAGNGLNWVRFFSVSPGAKGGDAAEAAGHKLSPVMWRWALRRRDTGMLQQRVTALQGIASLLDEVESVHRPRVLSTAAALVRIDA